MAKKDSFQMGSEKVKESVQKKVDIRKMLENSGITFKDGRAN